MDLEPRGREIDQPDLLDPDSRVERDLDAAVQPQGGVGDLDQQQHVGRLRMRGGVEVLTRAQQDDIGLQLAIFRRELDRILEVHDGPVTEP
jgi:hypothetical protein